MCTIAGTGHMIFWKALMIYCMITCVLFTLLGISIECCKSCYTDCQDLLNMRHTISGVYRVTPEGTFRGYDVYCDMETDDGGWLVFQRRVDGSVDFYRDWHSYVYGFGNISHEHWLGLDTLHIILQRGHYQLRINMKDWDGETAYATYNHFMIGNSAENFKLIVGRYKGNASDSLKAHNGQAFSAKDKDNDIHNTSSCAYSYKGAWWYYNCYRSNLNGIHQRGNATKGIVWYGWKNDFYSLKTVEMKIRRL